MINMIKLKTIDVKGKKFDVEVNEDGHFFADFDGERVKGLSIDLLTHTLLRRMSLKKKIAIPFCIWKSDRWDNRGGKLAKGVITGIYGSNGNLLVKFDGAKAGEQYSTWGNTRFFNLSSGAELERLNLAVQKATAELEAFEKKHGWNPDKQAKETLAKLGADTSEVA